MDTEQSSKFISSQSYLHNELKIVDILAENYVKHLGFLLFFELLTMQLFWHANSFNCRRTAIFVSYIISAKNDDDIEFQIL